MAFDLLYLDRRDLTGRPLRDRRARLEAVVAGSELVFPVRRLAPDGLEAWKKVIERGYEGYVAKDETQPVSGQPPRRWLRVKGPAGRTRGPVPPGPDHSTLRGVRAAGGRRGTPGAPPGMRRRQPWPLQATRQPSGAAVDVPATRASLFRLC